MGSYLRKRRQRFAQEKSNKNVNLPSLKIRSKIMEKICTHKGMYYSAIFGLTDKN